MNLRHKLLLAMSPLLVALGVSVVAGILTIAALGRSSQHILDENYRSVLAAQRMKDAVARIERDAQFILAGEPARELRAASAVFADELRAEEANITEPGEREAVVQLRGSWTTCVARLAQFEALAADARKPYLFAQLLPAINEVKATAESILQLNQDAMVQKSHRAQRSAREWSRVVLLVGIGGCALALVASAMWMSRLLRPMSVLEQAVKRLGQGDLRARAVVASQDEVGRLASEFNTMAGRLQQYRDSSLGELLQAQQALQAAIDSLPDPVLVVSSLGQLTQVNQAAETLLKVRPDDGDAWLSAIEGDLRVVIDRARAQVFAGKGAHVPKGLDEAARYATPDGDRHFLPRAGPVYDEKGTINGATIVLQDVTRLMRVDELRNDLVATVAHELRTPLTSIGMAVHLCAEETVGPINAKQADLLFAAKEDCERLQKIVDELLDMSRVHQGTMPLRKRAMSPEDVVRDALRASENEAASAKVALRSEVLPGSEQVHADSERLQIVMSNLLSNAIHHSPAGAAVVVRASVADDSVQFEVLDQGEGIPPEEAASVFGRYYQAPGGRHGAVGLGLAIAKEIVEQHGGAIGVDNAPGAGARFWFRLPLWHPPPT